MFRKSEWDRSGPPGEGSLASRSEPRRGRQGPRFRVRDSGKDRGQSGDDPALARDRLLRPCSGQDRDHALRQAQDHAVANPEHAAAHAKTERTRLPADATRRAQTKGRISRHQLERVVVLAARPLTPYKRVLYHLTKRAASPFTGPFTGPSPLTGRATSRLYPFYRLLPASHSGSPWQITVTLARGRTSPVDSHLKETSLEPATNVGTSPSGVTSPMKPPSLP